jgi:SAM-dependent methyltransferase
MTKSQWEERSKNWNSGPPLVPNYEVIDYLKSQIDSDANTLVLGVTREFYQAFNYITAVDREPAMIERVWLGNTSNKHAILDNWLTVDLPSNYFDAVLGDGSINMLVDTKEIQAVVDRCREWLRPNGKFICRMFTRPNAPVIRERLLAEVANPTMGWTAFRRLVPMVLAHEQGAFVPWARVYDFFNEMFPDRSRLPFTLKEISRMDAYKDVTTSTWFPTRKEILNLLPDAEFVDVGTYDIADTCPMMIIKK